MDIGDNVHVLGTENYGAIETIGQDDKGRFIVVRVPLPTEVIRGLAVRSEIKDLIDSVNETLMSRLPRDKHKRGVADHSKIMGFEIEVKKGNKAPLTEDEKRAINVLIDALLHEVFEIRKLKEGER